MAELESAIQRRCQQILKDEQCFVFKTHGSMFTRTGIPDLVACVPVNKRTLEKMLREDWFKKDDRIGIFLGLELKRPDHMNELSKAQEIVGNEIKSAGGLWFAIDDSETCKALVKMMRGEIE